MRKTRREKTAAVFKRRKTASCAKKDGLVTNIGKTKWHQKKQQPFVSSQMKLRSPSAPLVEEVKRGISCLIRR